MTGTTLRASVIVRLEQRLSGVFYGWPAGTAVATPAKEKPDSGPPSALRGTLEVFRRSRQPFQRIWNRSGGSGNPSRESGDVPAFPATLPENLELFPDSRQPLQRIWSCPGDSGNPSRESFPRPPPAGNLSRESGDIAGPPATPPDPPPQPPEPPEQTLQTESSRRRLPERRRRAIFVDSRPYYRSPAP